MRASNFYPYEGSTILGSNRKAKGMNKLFIRMLTLSCGLSIFLGGIRTSLAADVRFEEMNRTLAEIRSLLTARTVKIETASFSWEALENFHNKMFYVMALDPNRLPGEYIPEDLDPKRLTRELRSNFVDLKKFANIAKQYGATASFERYVESAKQILDLRSSLQYTLGRNIIKQGFLQRAYYALLKDLADKAGSTLEFTVVWNAQDKQAAMTKLNEVESKLTAYIASTRNQSHEIKQVQQKVAAEVKKVSEAETLLLWIEGLQLIGIPVLLFGLALWLFSRWRKTPPSFMSGLLSRSLQEYQRLRQAAQARRAEPKHSKAGAQLRTPRMANTKSRATKYTAPPAVEFSDNGDDTYSDETIIPVSSATFVSAASSVSSASPVQSQKLDRKGPAEVPFSVQTPTVPEWLDVQPMRTVPEAYPTVERAMATEAVESTANAKPAKTRRNRVFGKFTSRAVSAPAAIAPAQERQHEPSVERDPLDELFEGSF